MQGADGHSAALCTDAVLLAENEEQVERGLKVLEVWRKESGRWKLMWRRAV